MLYLLVGPIRSGKSTFTKEQAKQGLIVVNDDAITNAVHGGTYTLYDSKLKPLYKQVENTIITMGVALGRDIIIDRPCHKRSTRRRYVELAHTLDQEITYIVFPNLGAEFHGRARFEKDSRGNSLETWIAVAKEHEATSDPIIEDEGYDYILNTEHHKHETENPVTV